MTGRHLRPETEGERKLQEMLDKSYRELTVPPGRTRVRQPTRFERAAAFLKKLIRH